MISIDLNSHSAEDIKGIEIMRQLGFTEEEIQEKYNHQQELDNQGE